ncbi:hypothetical protein [Zobellia barbeyronii]|uniref:Oligosaccharide repeat unit polymerase n=1 Tax=Zobellia barbeyronii TaxID=2748009 RepID=A0ABS5WA00_9FLAO|nr:hypothetical protein [Zobellia barbeyronii]MBT2159748.1 hypothetical protein [Zobellia barbeyronii]
MLLIKLLSLILLLPFFFVSKKLFKKKDLNFFDLLIIFNTLYFVLIPLKSDEVVYKVLGKISSTTSILVFFYLLFFFITLLVASHLVKPQSNSPLNVTYFLKNYSSLQAKLPLKLVLIVLPIFALTYYVPHMSTMSAFEEIKQAGVRASYEESSMVKLFGTIFTLGLIISITLFLQNFKEKKYDILAVGSLLLFLVNLLLLPRRTLLEFILFGAIIFYSLNRDLINKKLMLYAFSFGMFLYLVYFPFYNIVRRSPVKFEIQSPVTSIQAIYDYGISSSDDANDRAANLTDSRAIYLYRAIYWVALNDNDKDITWGDLTLSAIDHAIPKVLNPTKGLGSELTLEARQHTNKDSADSVLLLALADYSMLGAIATVLIYFIVFKLLTFISDSSEFFFGKTIASLYVVYFVFKLAFATEKKLDSILADIVTYTLVIALIIFLHKTNLIIMSNKMPLSKKKNDQV